jgi:hypothetical protein
MSDKPARRSRRRDPNTTHEARDENARMMEYEKFLHDTMPAEKREAREGEYRRINEAARQAEEQLGAARLTPLESALVKSLDAVYLLYIHVLNDRIVLDCGPWKSEPELIARLYGITSWRTLGKRDRKRMRGRLRTLQCRANAKLAGLSLRIVRTPDENNGGFQLGAVRDFDAWLLGRRRDQDRLRSFMSSPRVQSLMRNYGILPEEHGRPRLQEVPRCMAYLRQRLAAGPVESRRVLCECRNQGFSPSTVRHARTRLGVIATHGEGYGANGEWWLELPAPP